MKVGRWSTTAANNNATPPDGWPEGQAPSTVNDCARENMAAIKTAMQDMDFFDHDFTPTFINANSFSIPGDQTARIVAGRQLKLFDGTTIYRSVGSASYTTVTTISLGAGTALTSSLSSFAVGILNPASLALPDRISASAIETTTLTASGAVVLLSTLSVGGTVTLNSTLSVSGATVLKTTLNVEGATSLSGAVALGTTLSVSGAAVLKSTLSVGGATIIEGAVQFGTTLSVSGAAVVKGAMSIGGALAVAGDITNPQVVKAFATWSGVGVVTLRQNYHVASITDVGVGNYTVNFTNAMSGTAYCVLSFCENDGVANMVTTHNNATGTKTDITYQVAITSMPGAVATDAPVVFVGVFGT